MCSYGAHLAQYWGRECRNEISSNPNIRLRLSEDSQAVGQWRTPEGGGMKADGAGGAVLGFRADLILVDDPIKDFEEASSPIMREKLYEWFMHTLMTRAEPGCSVIVLHHRWNMDDLTGTLLTQHPDVWESISLPAIALPGDVMGRAPGEALWPERWPVSSLQEAMKSPAWLPMYQQQPKLEAGDRVYDHFTQEGNLDKNTERFLQKGPDKVLGLALDFNVNPGMHACIVQYDPYEDMAVVHEEFHGERWRTERVIREFVKWVFQQTFGISAAFDVANQEQWNTVCRLLLNRGGKPLPWKQINIYGDRSGRNESTVTSQTDYHLIMKMLESVNIPHKICVPFKNPPVNDRVITVNEALRDGDGSVHLLVNPRCRRLVEDLAKQPRDVDGQPDKSNQLLGHSGDLCGYWLVWVRPTYRKQYPPQRQLT